MSKKVLVLYDSIEYFIPYMTGEDVKVERLYKQKNKLITGLKKVAIKSNIFNVAWYGDWVLHLESYHTIIVFATKDYTFIRHLKDKYPSIRLIFWYWNPAFRVGLPRPELYQMAEVWSFDPSDCEEYRLKFNTTFYFNKIEIPEKEILFDILFLGINKGRRLYLNQLREMFQNELKLNVEFLIVPDKKEKNVEPIKRVPYGDYLEMIASSKSILDLTPAGQSGLTLRPMESIFFKKKLISDNQNLLNESFYHPDNIFILGIDNLLDIKSFLNKPYREIDHSIVEQYDFYSWLQRFNIF